MITPTRRPYFPPPPRPPRARPLWLDLLIIAVVILTCLWAGLKIIVNEAAKGKPPLECQMIGGTWNLWDGWQCGK